MPWSYIPKIVGSIPITPTTSIYAKKEYKMVNHDRALNIACTGLELINLALEADTLTHESDEITVAQYERRLDQVVKAREWLEKIQSQITIIEHYTAPPLED